MDKILIDTDVILDFFFDREPFSEEASKILSLCEKGELYGYVTPVIISNVYYLLRKTAKHEKVIGNLKKLLKIVDVVVIDKTAVIEALNSDFKDFEDALQNYSVENKNDIKVIVTRNIKDYKMSKLSIMTPETFLKTMSGN
ncbi:type II toxin-antitoxin system VapC family toxin [Flavobacterium sp. HJJ]|uniref:type II toxin-antitoxin system VapC family toxin n=1 Tax=Flavobacterium sp. HJJ TaxID=2783792 RepID=UPI00188C06AF|nr:PIN domain-containing protein [Flavobacterium sp. HJJ]MBF4471856.1 PIN domain-containing protein [Flavobacterium sp. HJJ]